MKTGKVVYMERTEQNILNDALNQLDIMSDDLLQMAEHDDTVKDLAEDCKSAWACLHDFMDTYNRQFIHPDELD